jgi:diguanylate cyclase (GGDEF)-like protein
MSPERRPRRILVVDDDPHVLDGYRRVLGSLVGQPGADGPCDLDALSQDLFGESEPDEPPAIDDLVYCRQGEDAVLAVRTAMAEGRPFGVVFLDIRMPPGIDGLETGRRIRAIDEHANIVIVTGYSDHLPAAIDAAIGSDRPIFYMVKPFGPSELTQMATALSQRWSADLGRVQELARRVAELEALTALLVASEARARENARRDPMTDLLNRTAFTECFAEEAAAARAGFRTPALLYLDIDRFKRVNDTYGHVTGDTLIQEFARRLQHVVAENGITARLGGDEFAVICPDASVAGTLAERIIETCRQPYPIGSHVITSAVSIGVATMDDGALSFTEAMRRADSALYAAKAAGRGVAIPYEAEFTARATGCPSDASQTGAPH